MVPNTQKGGMLLAIKFLGKNVFGCTIRVDIILSPLLNDDKKFTIRNDNIK